MTFTLTHVFQDYQCEFVDSEGHSFIAFFTKDKEWFVILASNLPYNVQPDYTSNFQWHPANAEQSAFLLSVMLSGELEDPGAKHNLVQPDPNYFAQ